MSSNGNKQQMIFEEIMLKGPPPLRIEHARIPIGKIKFDPENPRLKYQKELFPGKTENELLFEHPDTNWLMKDIGEKGLLDPIYVRAVTKDATYYIVVEGNRRTAVMQQLHKDNPDNVMYQYMPARILPENTSEEQEALLMASFHVSGKIKWEAHEKAGHIWHMLNILHIPESELANTLHMAAPTIKRTAESYALLEHFKKVDAGRYAGDATGKWSFFSEMLKVKEFRDRYAKEGQAFADDFCRWVGDKRLARAEDVRVLPDIIKNKKAFTLFETHSPAEEAFTKARREMERAKPSKSSKFFKELEKVIVLGKDATMTEIDAARHEEASKELVLEAYQVLSAFMEQAGVRAPGTPRRVA